MLGMPPWATAFIWIGLVVLTVYLIRRYLWYVNWRTPYGDDDNDHLYLRHPHLHRPVAPPKSRKNVGGWP